MVIGGHDFQLSVTIQLVRFPHSLPKHQYNDNKDLKKLKSLVKKRTK